MTTQNKNVPALRFPEFNGNWESKSLGEISKDVMYGLNSSAIKFDGTNKYIRITDIDEDSREFIPKPLTSPDGKLEAKYKLKEGDILFTRTGASVGKSYLYKQTDGNLFFAGFLIKFSIVDANPYFVYAHTFKDSYNGWVQTVSMRSGQPGINAEEYRSLKITFPTLPEQQKIAAFLTVVDEKIQQLTKKKDLLEQYKKGVIQKIFNQEIRFKDNNGNDFVDWELTELKEIAVRVKDKNRSNEINKVLTNSATKGIVNQQDYFDKDIANQNNLEGYYIVEKDDFVYNPRISTFAPVGPIKRNNLDTGLMSPLYSVFRFNDVNLDFIEQFFETRLWHDYLKSIANYGARHDRMNITVEGFFDMPILLPTKPEQKKIADFLTSIDDKINLVNQQLEKTKEYKKGLLQKMFI